MMKGYDVFAVKKGAWVFLETVNRKRRAIQRAYLALSDYDHSAVFNRGTTIGRIIFEVRRGK